MLPYSSYPSYAPSPSPQQSKDTTGKIDTDSAKRVKEKAEEIKYEKPETKPTLDPKKPSKITTCVKQATEGVSDKFKKQ